MTDRSVKRNWHEVHDTRVALAEWLEGQRSFSTVANCILFFEKPWKWDREYALWRMWQVADRDSQRRERIIEALDDERSAEDLMAECLSRKRMRGLMYACTISEYLHSLEVLRPLAWHQARGLADRLAELVVDDDEDYDE